MSRPLHSKWESGLGMIEVMIAVGVVGTLALFSGYYAKMVAITTQPTVENRFSCATQTSTMLAKIRGQIGSNFYPNSFYPQTSNGFVTPTGTTTAPLAPFQFLTLVPNLWIGAPPILTNSPVPTAANALMMAGPMRALNSLYLGTYPSPVDFCTNGFARSTLLDTLSTDSQNILGAPNPTPTPQTQMQIQLYDLASGTVQSGCPRYWIHPQGIVLDGDPVNQNGFTIAGAQGPYFKEPPNYTDKYGFFVQVQTSYSELDPKTGLTLSKSCLATQKFSYDRDFLAPPLPAVQVVTGDPPDGGDATTHTATLTISVPSQEPGLVMVCRDRSTRQPQLPGYPSTLDCYSNSGAGPGPQPNPLNFRTVANPLPNETTVPVPGTLIGPSSWLPCEQVTLCGVATTGASISSTALGLSMTSTFSNIPSDCVIRIETAVMDSAANLNASSVTPYNPAQVVVSTPNNPVNNSNTPRPTCGQLCAPDGTWTGQSYWQYPSCCVVQPPFLSGCSPGLSRYPFGSPISHSTIY
jgi:hypothetical protein